MKCIFSCCAEEEPFKGGAFEVSHPNKNIQRQSYIPWVWSRRFHEAYQLGSILGQGAYGVVHEATATEPPQGSFAVKVLDRNRMRREHLHHLHNEMQILLELQHPNIIRLYELYKETHVYFMVFEKLSGGELFDRLCQKEVYSEEQARDICKSIFQAMSYCHGQNVAHRDMKPENLLLLFPDDDTHVKIADFGFAKRVTAPNSLHTRCGSPAYTAPEIVNGQPYDQRVDNWSLGVLVFTILGGYNPFSQPSVHLTFQQIRQCAYQFVPEQWWDGISPDAKNLIRGLLQVDREKRLTADQVLLHPWMTGRGDDFKRNTVNLDRLKEFNVRRKKNSSSGPCVDFYWLVSRR